MSKLTSPVFVSEILAAHGIRLKKKWGQNFLVDENILTKILDAAQIGPADTILEVGPGIGTLTQALASKAGRVITMEIDGRLIPVLRDTLGEYKNVEIIHADAMDINFDELLKDSSSVKLVANLPFNVATPLLYRWLKLYRSHFDLLVCMVQKEVAERITASPGCKDYGVLSVICQYTSKVESMFNVPSTVFFPRPKVASKVVRLCPKPKESDVNIEEWFFRVAESVFTMRRKTLLNTLHETFPFSKEQLVIIGRKTGIDLTRRGETLSIEEFAYLARIIYNKHVELKL